MHAPDDHGSNIGFFSVHLSMTNADKAATLVGSNLTAVMSKDHDSCDMGAQLEHPEKIDLVAALLLVHMRSCIVVGQMEAM
eukprot:3462484-Karenia_brevis.AAC.1